MKGEPRSRKPRDNPDDTAFLLAIDQFEELFTFADPKERERFDCLLAAALKDHDCPLYVRMTKFENLDSAESCRRCLETDVGEIGDTKPCGLN